MKHVTSVIVRLLVDDEGQDLIEYGLLVLLIAIVAVTGVTSLGNAVNAVLWQAIAAAL